MSRESDLGWAAGILDGEGCIGLRRQKSSGYLQYVLSVVVVNTNHLVLARLHEIFGIGAIISRPPRNEKWRPCFIWQVQAKKGEQVLRQLLPYLVAKHAEAVLALESRALMNRHGVNNRNTNVPQLETIRLRLSEMKKGIA